MSFNQFIFKYFVYYPVVFARREWVASTIRELQKSQYHSSEVIEMNQLKKLNKLLDHSKKNVPHYQKISKLKQLKSLDELRNIPFINKDILRNNQKSLLSMGYHWNVTYKTTGGSTGAPVTVAKVSKAMAQEIAAAWRGYSWAGIDIGDKQARFWGVPDNLSGRFRSKLIDFIANRYRCSAFAFDDQTMEMYVRRLLKFKPVYFFGYVSMLEQFAHYARRKSVEHLFSPKAIITTAEFLSDKSRRVLTETFGCYVFNEYGCGEVGTIAHECEHGNLHINSENLLVEVVGKSGEPLSPDEMGEIVVTELNNFAMPLIRYKLADLGVLTKERCSCGRNLPVLRKVLGREYDILLNSARKSFHGEFFLYMLEDLKKQGMAVNGIQIVQRTPLSLDINLVIDEASFKTVKRFLKTKIKKHFDSQVVLMFKKVSSIKREKSGKLRVVKRECDVL